MKLLIQRVTEARVEVDDKVVGSIQRGALVFVGMHREDKMELVNWLAHKLLNFRMFSDEEERMNLSLLDLKASLLIVSQFTLYASCLEGRRPSFTETAPPDRARLLYDAFVAEVKKGDITVETGVFGAKMSVHLVNDGPVTFILEHF